jgi:hypothetical protein
MANVLSNVLPSSINDYLKWAQIDPLTKQDVLRDVDDQLSQLVKFITDHLNARSDISSSSEHASLDVLFYLTSIFSFNLLEWSTPRRDSHFGQALNSLLDALHKKWTSGRKNDVLEKRFEDGDAVVDGPELCTRFSNEWWNKIFEHLTGPRTIGQGVIISFHFT